MGSVHDPADVSVRVVPVGDLGQVVDATRVLHAAGGAHPLSVLVKPLLVRPCTRRHARYRAGRGVSGTWRRHAEVVGCSERKRVSHTHGAMHLQIGIPRGTSQHPVSAGSTRSVRIASKLAMAAQQQQQHTCPTP